MNSPSNVGILAEGTIQNPYHRSQALCGAENEHSDYYHDYFDNNDYGIDTPHLQRSVSYSACADICPSPFTCSPTKSDLQVAFQKAASETK
jgi:hypothetical protein